MSPGSEGQQRLPAVEITVRFQGSCPTLTAGGRMVYRHPEIVKELSDRICGQALLGLIPMAEGLARNMLSDGPVEIPEAYCPSPGCGAIFSLRVLPPEEDSPAAEGASPATVKRPTRITKRLGKIDDVAETPFLSRLDADLVRELVDISLVSRYDTPTEVIHEGQEGEALYVVAEGEVEIVRSVDDKDFVLATLGKGDCFGEISLLTGQPATASVRSKGSDTAILVIPRETLDDLLMRRRALHREFSRIVAARLYRTNAALEAEKHQGITGRLSMIGIVDLIQTLHASRRTGMLAIDDSGRAAMIGFVNGDVTMAALDDLAGPEAFYSVLEWSDGYFSFEGGTPEVDVPGAAVSGGTMGLLMEGLRRMDERGHIS